MQQESYSASTTDYEHVFVWHPDDSSITRLSGIPFT